MAHAVPSRVEFSYKANHHWTLTEDYRTGVLELYCSDCDACEEYPLSDAEKACAFAVAHDDVQICWWVVVYPEEDDGRA